MALSKQACSDSRADCRFAARKHMPAADLAPLPGSERVRMKDQRKRKLTVESTLPLAREGPSSPAIFAEVVWCLCLEK